MPRISHLIAPALAATLALGIAAPASAKDRDGWRDNDRHERVEYRRDNWRGDRADRYDRRNDGVARDLRITINDLARDINAAERRGQLRYSPEIPQQLKLLRDRYDQYSHRGFNPREAEQIRNHAGSLRLVLNRHIARADSYGSRFGYGYGRR